MLDIPQIINSLQKKYCTTNPYELADKLDITISRCNLGTIRGYYYKAYRVKQIFLNINLERDQEKFVLSHELGHAVNDEWLKTFNNYVQCPNNKIKNMTYQKI